MPMLYKDQMPIKLFIHQYLKYTTMADSSFLCVPNPIVIDCEDICRACKGIDHLYTD